MILRHDPRRERRVVGDEHLRGALVTRLHEERQRLPGVPLHRHEIGIGLAVPSEVLRFTVEADDCEHHVRVRRARRGIRELGRLRRRVGRVGEVEAVDARDVDSARGDAVAVRSPPVAAVAPHLLGCDELGGSPRHVRIGILDDPRGAIEVCDAQRTSRHVRDPRPRRIGTRVEHRTLGVDLVCGAGQEVHGEQPTGERERSHRCVGVRRVRDDAARLLAGALPACSLLRGELGIGVGEQVGCVDDVDLFAAVDVEHPQPVHRIVAGARPREHDPRAVARHDEAARLTERQPASAGVLAGEGVGHGDGPPCPTARRGSWRAPRGCRGR